MLGRAAGDLRFRPIAARAEIKTENAGDDPIHIAGDGVRQPKCLGKEQKRQANHPHNQREQRAHRAFRQGQRQIAQPGKPFGANGWVGHKREAARGKPPQKTGEADTNKENHHTDQCRQAGGARRSKGGEECLRPRQAKRQRRAQHSSQRRPCQ